MYDRLRNQMVTKTLLLEGAYTGLLIYWFSYRADLGAQYRTAFMWLHGMLALVALIGIVIMSLRILHADKHANFMIGPVHSS